MRSDLQKIVTALQSTASVAILSHIHPEGDTIGSALGCHLTLKALGKEVATFNPDPVPKNLRGLPGAGEVIQADRLLRSFDCYLAVDATDPGRLGGLLSSVATGSLVINIDHHITNTRFGTYNWVDPEAAATGEMIYHLIEEMGTPLSREIATNLYVAILTDTGSFHYANTTPRALRVAAALIEAGVVPQKVADLLFDQREVEELLLLGTLLTKMQLSSDGVVAWMEVTQQMLEQEGLAKDALEGLINYPRSIKGVAVALLFKEEAKETVRVSLRSKGDVDVAAVAKAFQGGGHKNAAGCTLIGSLPEVRERVFGEIRRVVTAMGGESADGKG
ncbi:MAG: bifunctional oligoribonuclease/PAP phosphatase NrnA [candidate division NC10 bacterium]|nr:bifunctional oligoribonuclease/PAP phosphatase NrnA [candidate division NC10 bacterium]